MPRNLTDYRTKRNFERTPEPSGAEGRNIAPSDHLRFVVQKHDARRLHYDLRLEIGDVFKSWAVTRGPSLDPAEKRLAVEVEDHPLAYGDFEGTIPPGEYGGGTVMIWDRGFWAPDGHDDPADCLAKGELKFVLAGHKLRGGWVLVRMKPKSGSNEKRSNWLLIKHRDRWARSNNRKVLQGDLSVASGRTMAKIAKGEGAQPDAFMTNGGKLPSAGKWNEQATALERRRTARVRRDAGPSTTARMPKLSTPTRVLWPPREDKTAAITKRELADYLLSVAPWMIEHIYGRPTSLLRAPEGISKESFFQRHPLPGQADKIATVVVDKDHDPYLQINDAQTLVSMAQLSVIEFHPWNCMPFQPYVPGRMIFDLDPGAGVAFDALVEAAKELRGRLEALNLTSFCKTSGGKGLHVVVPLTPDETTNWEQAKLFSQTVAAQMAADSPTRFVTKMSKAVRKGRIFIDYLRNDFTATAVAPLSPRASPLATVSMPLNWTQVRKDLDPARFTISTAAALLKQASPWSDYHEAAQSLKVAIGKLVEGSK